MPATLRLIAAGLFFACACAVPALRAHHSFAAEYDAAKPITLNGEVERVDFVNPHGWIYMKVKEPGGRVVTWNVEMGSPNSLIRRGFTKNTVARGTLIVVNGYRAKDGSHTVNGTNVTLPDGRRLFTGSSGSGAPAQ